MSTTGQMIPRLSPGAWIELLRKREQQRQAAERGQRMPSKGTETTATQTTITMRVAQATQTDPVPASNPNPDERRHSLWVWETPRNPSLGPIGDTPKPHA